MATSEPWLTNVLNTPNAVDSPLPDSVPRSAPSDSVTLPPIEFGSEFDNIQRLDGPAPTDIASLCFVGEQSLENFVARATSYSSRRNVTIPPIQSLLQPAPPAPEGSAPVLPIRSIVNDVPRAPEDHPDKKRHRASNGKEDIQLPKLPKKRKSAQQIVPPTIPGLHEPPPDNMLLPPILSASNESYTLAPWKDFGCILEDRSAPLSGPDIQSSKPPKQKRRPMKPRRKWTEEETDNLLLGVKHHGVGNWTSILHDERFKFNDRTAGDLKDRFRTCRPDDLRQATAEGSSADGNSLTMSASEENLRPKNGLPLENILESAGEPSPEHDAASPSAPLDSDAAPRQRKGRAHRKTEEDLAKLGISGPFERSQRRPRRAFSQEDDQNILAGFNQYGPSWTKIQRDPKFNLASRHPTDLRDRVRNKFPTIYASIDKHHPKEALQARGDTLQPSVDPIRDSLSSLESQLSRSGSKENLYGRTMTPSGYESTESLPALADVIPDKYDTSAIPCYIGAMPDMDMGNLILDDSNPFDVGERRFSPAAAASEVASPASIILREINHWIMARRLDKAGWVDFTG